MNHLVLLNSIFDFFGPIRDLWWAFFGIPIKVSLTWLYLFLQGIPFVAWIGAYGAALVLLTLGIKLILAPLTHFQLKTTKQNLENQRRLAPELAEIKRKYKGDLKKQQEAQMALYQKHGVNPVTGGLVGCLPLLLQLPILMALYSVLVTNARDQVAKSAHFLFIPNLNVSPHSVVIPGTPIPVPVYLIIPLLAAILTYVQTKMTQQPLLPTATEQEIQTQQMMKSMQIMVPLMVLFFGISYPVGLGLYWLMNTGFAIIQQYFVNGWGGLSWRQGKTQAEVGASPAKLTPEKRIPAKRKKKRNLQDENC